MTFLRAVSAEFMKIFTTRIWWVLALILFGYVGFARKSATLGPE